MANLLILSAEVVKSGLDTTGLGSVEVGDMDNLHATIPRFLEISNMASL